ncbi:hypothetical protein LSUE1_G000987 [Lachnellula suecica]|uniref:DOMON domain-containing protein n=1 Tax=Lachnellula suecica TaxID=602035 RepID=A0A8T9CIJ8_9HELO|nr:hypothetical protein LSUE1_G000987 [Lachnellula suecica]
MHVWLSSVLVTAGFFCATAIAVSSTNSSGFVASDGSLSFALNVPQDNGSDELYFSLVGDSSCSWLAFGMGSQKMKDSLTFMVYSDASGKNVTVSPRLVYDHSEPTYTNNVTITVLPGTKIDGNTTTLNAKCSNCRAWKGGSVDPTNTAANLIFATGPSGNLNTNSLTADIKRHASYGVFQMDLTKSVGAAGVPNITTSNSAGVKELKDQADHDVSAPLHACLMIIAFVGLMPLGVLILRVLNSPKWHGINQTLSFLLALIGAFLGLSVGTMYNRTKGFNTAHQIIGIIVIMMMIGQFVLGFMHHRMYKKTQAPTKLSPYHIWLGRVVIPAGIINGFLGFPLALVPKYDFALLALVLLLIIVLLPFAFWRYRRNIQKAKTVNSNSVTGYQSRPWENQTAQNDINLNQMNYPPHYGKQGYGR